MQEQQTPAITELWSQFGEVLPRIAAGLLVIVIGMVAGWLIKRAVVRLLVWLRLDRLAGRVGWRAAFGKGDVRSTLYNLAGNIAGLVIFLVFVDDALTRLGLTALSRIIDNIVFYLPNLVLSTLIVGVGLLVSNGLAERVTEALEEEEFRRARLIGKAVKASLMAVVVALALWQLQFAREIVLAAFLISFGSIGISFALGVGLGSFKAVEKGLTSLFDRKDDA